MKTALIFVVIMLIVSFFGCSLNQAITDSINAIEKNYNAFCKTIVDKVGSENVKLALSLYKNDVAADYLLAQYEQLAKEKFSPKNRVILLSFLTSFLSDLRARLEIASP